MKMIEKGEARNCSHPSLVGLPLREQEKARRALKRHFINQEKTQQTLKRHFINQEKARRLGAALLEDARYRDGEV